MPQAAYKGKKSAAPALGDLRGIGRAMLGDFELLGIKTVEQLSRSDGADLYDRLQELRGVRQDPCVLDTFRCAVAQARNPHLPDEQRNWWYWSKLRKEGRSLSSHAVWPTSDTLFP